YCQDSPLSWFDWSLRETNADLLRFTQRMIEFRQTHPVFYRRHWFQGREIHGSGVHDICWYNSDGSEVTDEEWHDSSAKAIGIFLNGAELPDPDPKGQRILDDDFLLFFNAQPETQEFAPPANLAPEGWELLIDTKDPQGFVEPGTVYSLDQEIPVAARSLMVLHRPRKDPLA
ncbi:glycogen debranching enzyme, partial [filamentous cyanobacterium CCP5]